MLKKTIEKIVPFTILPIAVFSVQLYTPVPVGNTAFWWLINTLILFTYFWTVRYSYISPEDRKAILFLKLYLIWNIFSIARGLFAAEIYWDYKGDGLTVGIRGIYFHRQRSGSINFGFLCKISVAIFDFGFPFILRFVGMDLLSNQFTHAIFTNPADQGKDTCYCRYNHRWFY